MVEISWAEPHSAEHNRRNTARVHHSKCLIVTFLAFFVFWPCFKCPNDEVLFFELCGFEMEEYVANLERAEERRGTKPELNSYVVATYDDAGNACIHSAYLN